MDLAGKPPLHLTASRLLDMYANEFDIEGLIASAGTFAMEAHKKNILEVLDRYEMVYENLKTHDPDYPAPH